MRIIGGELGGLLLPFPKKFNSRATTDVAKESLFNILDNNFTYANITVLDLFSGTGNISYEFASRGCREVTSVELNGKNVAFIKEVITKYELSQITPVRVDAMKFISNVTDTYDIIFADPPYNSDDLAELPGELFKKNILKQNGWFIIEHPKKYNYRDHSFFFDERRYGHVCFSFFRNLM